ncbi:hypothetical protein [uncultured Fusobacterium sp.]|jgi:hypothetical protein|uniref:hypothetical protein n=1 Tax=uncultured Fusobacterium sp. TaxID=159267 RepID=UPI0027DD0798|nr:hypothetical protein [uncultured Fusobacterium sp.]
MIHIYKGEKYITSLNYSKEEFKKEWYPEFEDGMLISETKYSNPILDNGTLREKTREELILEGKEEFLVDGWYVAKGKILKKEIPENLIFPIWNKDKKVWEDGMTKEKIIELRKNKIIEYEKLEEEKKLLEKSKFSSEDEMKAIIEKMAVIEGSINELADKIKAL